nr:helix-hairpin-helix domain-containing protein [Actinomycetospora corticicola]
MNSAPAPVIADLCGLEPAQAGRIVQARQAAGRFASVEDVFSWTELPVDTWDRIRDRSVTV